MTLEFASRKMAGGSMIWEFLIYIFFSCSMFFTFNSLLFYLLFLACLVYFGRYSDVNILDSDLILFDLVLVIG